MKVIIWFDGETTIFDISVANLPQIKNYLGIHKPDVWAKIGVAHCTYTLGTLDNRKPPVSLYEQSITSDLSSYDFLVIAQAVSGEAFFTAIAAAVSAAVASSIGAGILATTIGYAVASVVMIGISYALGQVTQLLSPTKKTATADTVDAALAQKNMLFNGVQNIREQGGGVPIVFGECLIGGVVISLRVGTSEVLATSQTVLTMSDAMNPGLQGVWLCRAR